MDMYSNQIVKHQNNVPSSGAAALKARSLEVLLALFLLNCILLEAEDHTFSAGKSTGFPLNPQFADRAGFWGRTGTARECGGGGVVTEGG
jgi:hypothetical protein